MENPELDDKTVVIYTLESERLNTTPGLLSLRGLNYHKIACRWLKTEAFSAIVIKSPHNIHIPCFCSDFSFRFWYNFAKGI